MHTAALDSHLRIVRRPSGHRPLNHLQIEPERRGQRHRLGHGLDAQADDHLVDNLHRVACPRPAHVGDGAAGRLQHGRDALEIALAGPRHDRQRAGLRRWGAARHRRVDPAHPELGECRRSLDGVARVRAAHIDHDRIRAQVLGGPCQQRPGGGRVRHDDHHHLGLRGRLEVLGELDARDLLGRQLRAVPAANIEPRRAQRAGDRTAHQPQAEHADRRLATTDRPGRGHGGNLHAPLHGVTSEVSR